MHATLRFGSMINRFSFLNVQSVQKSDQENENIFCLRVSIEPEHKKPTLIV